MISLENTSPPSSPVPERKVKEKADSPIASIGEKILGSEKEEVIKDCEKEAFKECKVDFISILPQELIQSICLFTDLQTLFHLRLVGKILNSVARDTAVVKQLTADFIIEQVIVIAENLPEEQRLSILLQLVNLLIKQKNLSKALQVEQKMREGALEQKIARCNLAQLMAEQNCGKEEELLLKKIVLDESVTSHVLDSLLKIAGLLVDSNPTLASKAVDTAAKLVNNQTIEESMRLEMLKVKNKLDPLEIDKMIERLPNETLQIKLYLLEEIANQNFDMALSLAMGFEGLEKSSALCALARMKLPSDLESALFILSVAEKQMFNRNEVVKLYAMIHCELGMAKLRMLAYPVRCKAWLEISENIDINEAWARDTLRLFKSFDRSEGNLNELVIFLAKRLANSACSALFEKLMHEVNFTFYTYSNLDFKQGINSHASTAFYLAIQRCLKNIPHCKPDDIRNFTQALARFDWAMALSTAKRLKIEDDYFYIDLSLQAIKRNLETGLKIINNHIKDDVKKATAYLEILKAI